MSASSPAYRKDLYSTNDAQRRDPYSGVILNQGINDRLWTSFWYKKHNLSGYTPYRFDTLDDPRQHGMSIGYVLTPRDTVIFTWLRTSTMTIFRTAITPGPRPPLVHCYHHV